MYRYIKCLLIGILLLFLFHFESLSLGIVKISHLWKGVLLIYMVVGIIGQKNNLFIYGSYIFLAILQVVNVELFDNPFNAIVNLTTTLLIPVMGIYVLRFHPSQLRSALIFFSSFFILSFIPYKLGILDSYKEGYDLESFGGTFGLVGPFQNPHTASLTLAGSLLIVLYFWFQGFFNRTYLIILFILGSYFLLNTYVRTGMVMVVVGILPLLFHFIRKRDMSPFRIIFFVLFFVIMASNWIISNEVLINRITGENKYRQDYSFESMGSGRGGIYLVSIEIFDEATVLEKIFGLGNTKQVELISNKMGVRIGSHNGFLDILLTTGIIGLLAFLYFLFCIYRICTMCKNEYTILTVSLFVAIIVMTLVQGINRIPVNLLFALSIAITYHSRDMELNKMKQFDFSDKKLL